MRWCAQILGVAILAAAVPCFGDAILSVDSSCNPAVDTPVAGGCTWYNFYAHTDNTITTGSSFSNYYSAAPGNPPWTITTTGYTDLLVLDGGHQGDTFDVLDNGVDLGFTSSTPIDAAHACAGDPNTGADPSFCWNDALMSRGTYLLAPGNHSITVVWEQRVPGGDSTLQWFELGATSSVPEPTSILLVGGGLIGAGLIRRRRNAARFDPNSIG